MTVIRYINDKFKLLGFASFGCTPAHSAQWS